MKAIGYSFYNEWSPNFLIIGDGNFYMNGNDIITLVENNKNLNVIILNNLWYASLENHEKNDVVDTTYKKGIDFQKYSEAIWAKNYYKIDSIPEIQQLNNIDFYSWVNILEVIAPFNLDIPLWK